MNEFLNWHDTWILAETHVVWIIVAFGIGAVIGWRSCEPVNGGN